MFHFPQSAAAASLGTGKIPRPAISKDEYTRLLETASRATEAGDANAALLLAKLGAAQLCEPGELPSGVVSMEDFVTYSTETGRLQTRALIYPEDRMWSPAEISVLTPLGQPSWVGARVSAFPWALP